MTASLTGETIDQLIADNGGLGEWETTADGTTSTNRWLFPRFDGADEVGTCGVKAKAHAGNHKRTEKCGESFTPDIGNMYLSRTGLGRHDSDVEMIAAWLDAPRNVVGGILLLGEPGTGKTALAEASATYGDRKMVTHLCTPDDTRDSLFLRFVGEGKGENGAPFVKGVIPHAAEIGATLYLDEYFMLNDGVKPITYELMDGRRFLSGGNVDGSALEIHPDFRVILSSNPLVRGASLPEPVGSRCAGTTLTVETSEGLLRDLGIEEDLIATWRGLGMAGLWQPQVREMRISNYWFGVDNAQAASALMPEHAPESQRTQIRDTVLSYIGSGLRADGRLVVS